MSFTRILDVSLTTTGVLLGYHSLVINDPQSAVIAGVCLGVGIGGLVRKD